AMSENRLRKRMTGSQETVDRRVARTRASLHMSLHSLMVNKGYDAVTVEEICVDAHVARSTFYAHYTGKDDLRRSGLKRMRQTLLCRQKEELTGIKARSFGFSLWLFKHAKDHKQHYRALNGSGAGAVTLNAIRGIVRDLVRAELMFMFPKQPRDSYSHEFVIEYVVGAYMALLIRWLEDGAKQLPEQIDQIFLRLATKGIDDFRCC
ncbi:MAG: TetR/AcrR family transcriptional regulator, partial [Alphaproteobacteria bacterium]|nr:TetR/AcrR family transcriptional regulator [Alphaproteobacteria bacterium]